jgi:hypothetical protein
MVSLNSFKVDKTKASDAQWVDVAGYDGFRLLVRSRRSREYKKANGREMQRLTKVMSRRGGMPVELMAKVDNACLAEACLLGWEGLSDQDTGEPLAYTPEVAKELMTNDDFEMFQEIVRETVTEVDNSLTTMVEEVSGN